MASAEEAIGRPGEAADGLRAYLRAIASSEFTDDNGGVDTRIR